MNARNRIEIFIDQQKITIEDREYTPRELLELAGDNPSETTLALKHGHEITKLSDLDERFQPKEGDHFVVYHNSPTPVS